MIVYNFSAYHKFYKRLRIDNRLPGTYEAGGRLKSRILLKKNRRHTAFLTDQNTGKGYTGITMNGEQPAPFPGPTLPGTGGNDSPRPLSGM